MKKVFEIGEKTSLFSYTSNKIREKSLDKNAVYIKTQLILIYPQSLQWICAIFGLEWHAIKAYMISIKAIQTNCGRLNSEGVLGFRQIEGEWISLNIVFSLKKSFHIWMFKERERVKYRLPKAKSCNYLNCKVCFSIVPVDWRWVLSNN